MIFCQPIFSLLTPAECAGFSYFALRSSIVSSLAMVAVLAIRNEGSMPQQLFTKGQESSEAQQTSSVSPLRCVLVFLIEQSFFQYRYLQAECGSSNCSALNANSCHAFRNRSRAGNGNGAHSAIKMRSRSNAHAKKSWLSGSWIAAAAGCLMLLLIATTQG